MSDQNQFTDGGVSSCTINAIEAAFRLLGKPEKITKGLIDEIIQVGSLYNSQTHTDFETLHKSIPRFNKSLEVVFIDQKHVREINAIIDQLQKYSMEKKNSIAAICTKAPETIALYANMEENEYVVFDSHSRKQHSGAAFIYFLTLEGMIKYLKKLFPIIHLDFYDNYQELMLNSINVTYISLKSDFVGSFKPSKQELKKLLWEIRDFEQQNFKEQISILKNKLNQLDELQKKNEVLEKKVGALNLKNQGLRKNSNELRRRLNTVENNNKKRKKQTKNIFKRAKKILGEIQAKKKNHFG